MHQSSSIGYRESGSYFKTFSYIDGITRCIIIQYNFRLFWNSVMDHNDGQCYQINYHPFPTIWIIPQHMQYNEYCDGFGVVFPYFVYLIFIKLRSTWLHLPQNAECRTICHVQWYTHPALVVFSVHCWHSCFRNQWLCLYALDVLCMSQAGMYGISLPTKNRFCENRIARWMCVFLFKNISIRSYFNAHHEQICLMSISLFIYFHFLRSMEYTEYMTATWCISRPRTNNNFQFQYKRNNVHDYEMRVMQIYKWKFICLHLLKLYTFSDAGFYVWQQWFTIRYLLHYRYSILQYVNK